MRILMTNHALLARAGPESYLETVAVELRRLGHEVTLFAPDCGDVAERLRSEGFQVVDDVAALPDDVDVIHGQHLTAVGLVRERFPRTPLVMACHSWVVNTIEDPVPELGVSAYVVYNALTEARLRAHAGATGVEIVRLTQPVPASYGEGARAPIRTEPARAVAVSRRMKLMPGRLEAACAARGIQFDWVGGPDRESADARREMREADIVFALGRTALEAMMAGRAVAILDDGTCGGWVTAESYARLEADGFTGLVAGTDEVDLDALLAGYSQDLGMSARRLALRHHMPQQHAAALVDLYARVSAAPVGPAGESHTLALLAAERMVMELRLGEAHWDAAEARRVVHDVRWDVQALAAQLGDALEMNAQLRAELEKVRAQRDNARVRGQKARRQRDEARRELGDSPRGDSGGAVSRFRRRRSR